MVPDRFTWSFEAPKYIQHDLIREWLGSKLKDWQQQRNQYLSSTLDNQSNGTNGHSQNHFDQDSLGEVEETYFQHLSSTYESWKALPDKHKQEIWRAECAKAFAREQEKHKETTSKLELAEQEIQHLRAQLSQRSPYDPGSDYSLFPNSTLPISRATSSQLPNPATWNSESLISTWRARIQHQRSVQQPLPPPSPWATATPPNLNNSDHRTNGTMPLPHPDRSSGQHRQDKEHDPPSDDDEDLADAPGDEDTFGQEQELEMERGVLDPDLRGGERSGGGGDVDGEGGRMLMGLRDHTDYGNAQGGIGTGRV